MVFIILGAVLTAGWYFGIRYFLLERALRKTSKELWEINGSPEQNRILRLPFPDRSLGELMESVNGTLETVRRERLTYEKREKEFQEQIENISHDLRTPLTVILGYLKMEKRRRAVWEENRKRMQPPQSGEVRQEEMPMQRPEEGRGDGSFRELWKETEETMEALERNARILEKLVAQFYLYSRVTAGDYEMEAEKVDVCRILRESMADNYRILERLSLKTELPEHPVTVRGNREALERIFLNLLQNAGWYGESRLEVRVEEKGEGQVGIVFENDGAEMTKEELSQIFHRFYKGDSARNRDGSGLGLAIARTLAERMGGKLSAEIPEGEAARLSFILLLPISL